MGVLADGRSPDVVVVGGGAIGCASAWFLAREGLRVTLLEREDIAGEASGAAAGMLAPVGELGHGAADPRAGAALFEWGRRSLDLYPELCERLTGRAPDHAALVRHLEQKLSDVYRGGTTEPTR